MKRSEILGLVHAAIFDRPVNPGVRWYICWYDGKIQCLPMCRQPKPEIIFKRPTDTDLRTGFDTTEWAELEAQIYTFLKEKGLCQIQ